MNKCTICGKTATYHIGNGTDEFNSYCKVHYEQQVDRPKSIPRPDNCTCDYHFGHYPDCPAAKQPTPYQLKEGV